MGNKTEKKGPEQSAEDKMFDTYFEFKMMAKSFAKESNKAATAEKQLLVKVKNAIEKGDYEGAKVLAADCIRKKNEIQRYKVLSSKIDTISQRLQTAYKTQALTENMKSLTEKMVGATNTMDMVQMNETMENFEKMFDNLDVNSEMMNQVFDNVNAGTSNESEVNNLINIIAEQNGLKVADEMEINAGNKINMGQKQQQANQDLNFP